MTAAGTGEKESPLLAEYRGKRILFTVAPTSPPVADYGAILTSHVHKKKVNHLLTASYPVPSWGLFWIKENCPEIELLDMPDWKQLEKELKKGVDILAIGFYTYQVPAVIRLVELARQYGVGEIWGGNYGVQTPGVSIYFDKIISGNGEAAVYRILYGRELETIKHPVVVQTWSLGGLVGRFLPLKSFSWTRSGVIWTIKGCYYNCKFCVSHSFLNKTLQKVPLSELERVLDKYVSLNIKAVTIMDLDFLMDETYANAVIGLLHERNLAWTCMTRIDHIQDRIGELKKKGCEVVFIGVESLNVVNLAEQNKYKINHRQTLFDLFTELKQAQMGYYLFYMLGFEYDTVESLKQEIDFLATLQASFYQFQIVTPLPGSKMFAEYKNRIINWNWEDWNCNTLVWKHPQITPKQMQKILIYAKRQTSLPRILPGILERGILDDSFSGDKGLVTLLKVWLKFCVRFRRFKNKLFFLRQAARSELGRSRTSPRVIRNQTPD